MKTYAERLAWAMECRGLSPNADQSTLAKLVGPPCKPQNIQHLLDPNKNAKSSKYTPRIATILKCDVLWLADGSGRKPEPISRFDSSHEIGPGDLAEKSKYLAENDDEKRVNPSSSEFSVYGKVPNEQLDEFIAEVRAAWNSDRLSPRRFALLRELLREGTDLYPKQTKSLQESMKQQQIPTRVGHARRARGKRSSG